MGKLRQQTRERQLTKQYLAKIGYVLGPEQLIPDSELNLGHDKRSETAGEVQVNTLRQLSEQYTAQRQSPAAVPSRSASHPHRPKTSEEPSILHIESAVHSPETEASHQILDDALEHEAPSPNPAPSLPTKPKVLTDLHSELNRRQKICLDIEHQLNACQISIQSLPSKKEKINKEHDNQITDFAKPTHDANKTTIRTTDAAIDEIESIYQQYNLSSTAPPKAKFVDTLFAIIADTETRLKDLEEASKAARRREGKLECQLSDARCAILETEDEITSVEKEGVELEAQKQGSEEGRIEGDKEGKRKPRRGKGGKGKQEGRGGGGDERVGRRRKRTRDRSGRVGKMGADAAILGS